MRNSKNLIMGLWSGLDFWHLEPFIASLRRTAFSGDICVMVSDVSAETIAALHAHGILVERFDRLALPPLHGGTARYFAYLDFLARHADEYAHVMLSDLRDVVFQSDPFAQPLPADVVFAQERCLMGDSPVNRNWIADIYGA